jgi:uncharacterized membrane protein YbhN (UPF0104 family)
MSELVLSGWRYRALVASTIVAALGYLVVSLWGGLRHVVSALQRVGFMGMAVMLFMSLLNYGLRFMRWQQYLDVLAHPIPWRPSARIYLAGFALTTTPGKAGEALRGVLLKRWHVPYTHSLAAFVCERLSDLVAIVLLALVGLSLYPQMVGVVVVGAAGVLAGLVVLSQQASVKGLAAWGANGIGRLRGLAIHLSKMLEEARTCHAPKLLATATLLSLVAWLAEALAFHWMLGWLGVEVPLVFSVFVYAVAMLAGALSFLPGGLGGAEAVMVGLLLWKGVSLPEAVAATVLIRLTTLWFAVVLGVIALALSRHDGKAA